MSLGDDTWTPKISSSSSTITDSSWASQNNTFRTKKKEEKSNQGHFGTCKPPAEATGFFRERCQAEGGSRSAGSCYRLGGRRPPLPLSSPVTAGWLPTVRGWWWWPSNTINTAVINTCKVLRRACTTRTEGAGPGGGIHFRALLPFSVSFLTQGNVLPGRQKQRGKSDAQSDTSRGCRSGAAGAGTVNSGLAASRTAPGRRDPKPDSRAALAYRTTRAAGGC